ncbi:FAD-dependent oxidoreductase [Paucibacter sp. AS339]|uniref:FAD-dependent oxidoreductase n=1 Tax=Paucibacter hankyongi TaxID=3133434 RepID=UPI0030B6DAF7
MRIAIIGAGIAGVTSAFECANDGHQVTVFERRSSVAAEGSFANTGFAAPALALPWAAARFPRPGAGALSWQWRRWRAERSKDHAARQALLLQLASYSHGRLQELRKRLQLDYERTEGQLLLLRHERELRAIQAQLDLMQSLGLPHQFLSPEQCLALEPGLNPETPLHGGIQLSQAEVGNCRQFSHLMRIEAQRLGVQFRFHTTVRSITPGQPASLIHEHTIPPEGLGAATRGPDKQDAGDTQPAPLGPVQESFDAVLICAGAGALALLQPLGLKPALSTVHGYSITAPLRQLEAHPDLGPRAGLLDLRHQVSISRIGQRVRIAGGIETGTSATHFKPATLALLHQVLHDWFPGAMQVGQEQRWKGSQALLPDGLPLLGASGLAGVWLNLAQGSANSLDWPLACGAARVLADQICKRKTDVDAPDTTGLDIARLA